METITVALPNVSIISVYKPHQSPFLHSELPDRCKNRISIGDFNAHSTLWGYEVNNQDGDEVETWLESKHLTLIHDAKLPKSFHSARCKRGYNPNLDCVSSELTSRVVKEVLDPIPHTQHQPITITNQSNRLLPQKVQSAEGRLAVIPTGDRKLYLQHSITPQ